LEDFVIENAILFMLMIYLTALLKRKSNGIFLFISGKK